MNKTLLTLALVLAAPAALATAPVAGYVQVQDSNNNGQQDDYGGTPGEGQEGVAEEVGENVDQAAQDVGNAVENTAETVGDATQDAVDAAGNAVDNATDTASEAVSDAVDPNAAVDTNNDGTADTRQFPWGLLGLLGLFGLAGRNRRSTVVHTTTNTAARR
ncbi:WGxxGxxG-CTERM domain-containing protein [Deinococcus sp. YIM 77859]|uniref:WGxxGxxG-CTERM domain-containing protein n=1 Tax=Deinococcus sp. YIM 77859 TaxID=1540221 RepID=UPI0005535DED|nr:WGxxGxxG-CTERM domain-containing protein [Deinococcus sp. YIM 77859]